MQNAQSLPESPGFECSMCNCTPAPPRCLAPAGVQSKVRSNCVTPYLSRCCRRLLRGGPPLHVCTQAALDGTRSHEISRPAVKTVHGLFFSRTLLLPPLPRAWLGCQLTQRTQPVGASGHTAQSK